MPAGRPSELENIDMSQVEIMGKFRATHETMADYFGVCVRTIERYMSDEEGEFCRVYKKGFANCKLKLSEAQVNLAMEGNATMLVWLGKQHLDQKDKQEIDNNVTISKEPKIVIKKSDD
jgi:hypothetical protein